jgi:hypothetical protein
MDSKVSTRPNHYAVLGVKPTASQDEIGRAFIKQMFSPRPMVQAAEIGAAYEVLRNPAKRRAYDASLGFREEQPKPVLSKPVIAFSTRARYIAAAPAITFEPPALDARPTPPVAEPEARPEPAPMPEPAPALQPELDVSSFLAAGRQHQEREQEERGFEWRRPAVIAAGLVAAVGLVGAWAGSLAGNDVEAQVAENAVTVALPQAKAEAPAPAVASAPKLAEAHFYPLPTRRAERSRARSAPTDLQLEDLSKGREAEAAKPAQHSYYQTTADDGTTEIAAAEAPPLTSTAEATTTAASMPLPKPTIARTLHRIGYSCGSVASTSAVDGQAGVFTVTCTSGQSYRASPQHGRYRFKKL